MRRYITIVCVALLFAFTAEATTMDDAKLAIRTQDFTKAAGILKPLANKGDKQAQYQLAVLYRNGQGINENPEKSVYWLNKSASQGYKRAQYLLGTFYEDGIGVENNKDKAIYWYSAAAKQNHGNAQKRLTKIQSDDSTPVIIDKNQSPEETLIHAVISGDAIITEQLLESGVSPDTRDKYQCPVLLYATSQKNETIVKLLIKYGADVNAVDKYRDSPLLIAANLGEKT